MVSVLTSSAVDRGFEPRSGQTKDYTIGICCFSAKHAALRRKRKEWLGRNQNNVSEWGDISTRGLLFQWASTIKTQLSVLVQDKAHLIIIPLKINLLSPWYSWKIAELVLDKQQSLTHSTILQLYVRFDIELVKPHHLLLKCLYKARKMSGHVLDISIFPVYYNVPVSYPNSFYRQLHYIVCGPENANISKQIIFI
jgi:hypothetical protein